MMISKPKLMKAALFCLITSLPMAAGALNLTKEFESMATNVGGMSSTVSPEKFRADAMKGYNFGGMSMRVPVKKINLVQIERASINAGCHGVDIRFGGMAFISMSEIVNQLKLIAKGAPALIYNMTLQAIAAPLVNTLNHLYDIMARLSSSLKNSCEASMALIKATDGIMSNISNGGIYDRVKDSFSGNEGKRWQLRKKEEASEDKTTGPESDSRVAECIMTFMSLGLISSADSDEACGKRKAPADIVKDTNRAIDRVVNDRNIMNEAAARAYFQAQYGNKTWNALQLLGVAPVNSSGVTQAQTGYYPNERLAILLQSLIGAEVWMTEDEWTAFQNSGVSAKDYSAGGSAGSKTGMTATFEATLSPKDFFALFVCGSPNYVKSLATTAGSSEAAAVETCKTLLGMDNQGNTNTSSLNVIGCRDTIQENQEWMGGCKIPEVRPLETADFSDESGNDNKGMIFHVVELLKSSVEKSKTGVENYSNPERALISMAPFPLYEIINVAAASPHLADALIDANAQILAFYFAGASLDSLFDSIMSADGLHSRMASVPNDVKQQFFDVQQEMEMQKVIQVEKLSLYKDTVDLIMHHVKSINADVLKSTMAMGIGGADFSDALSVMVNQ